MARKLTLGLLQLNSESDKRKNLAKINKLLKSASADLVALPEYSMCNITGLKPSDVYQIAENIDGEFVKELINIAKSKSMYMVATIFEKSDKPPKVYNTALLLSPKGEILGVYRKIHLFDAYGYKESNYMLAGKELSPIINIGKAKIALAICFDIRFPELFRIYALKGAEVIVIPSAWYKGPLKEETLVFLARSRAHENTVYITLVNQYGPDFIGRSMIIDPLGVVLIDLGVGEKYIEFTINLESINEIRRMLPVLNLRKPEIYKEIIKPTLN